VVNTNYVAWTNGFLILSGSSAQVNFFGSPGVQYEVDRATNLVAGVGSGWVPISTNVAPFSGIIQVQDSFLDLGGPGAQPPATAFYRLKPNP